ncbi:N-acetylmuramoyl-L-alanine amidase [Nocardiopsis rhodophaea]|uniref:peptidoglycan recognition protein family protein n=1 Tax=Nocardiopsis rhodophaea TaxID=280238 RepID=UPI0031DD85DC
MSGAKWRPIHTNYSSGGISPRIVVVHIMAGTLDGTDSWFRQSRARASSHFGTGKNGALYQWVDTSNKAWAQAGGNGYCISIENEGRVGDKLTDAQLDRNAQILAWAHEVYGIPLRRTNSTSGSGLGWHGMGGSAWGGHESCPGSRIVGQLDEIVSRARKLAGNGDTPGSSGGAPSTGSAPGFPLPHRWAFGPRTGPNWQVSGFYSHRSDLRRWQQRMLDRGWYGIGAADGLYGPRTARVARQFQAEKGLHTDSLIGKATWDAAWTTRVT